MITIQQVSDTVAFMDLDDFGAYQIYVRLVRFYRLGGHPDVRLTKGLRAKSGQVRQVRFGGLPDMGRNPLILLRSGCPPGPPLKGAYPSGQPPTGKGFCAYGLAKKNLTPTAIRNYRQRGTGDNTSISAAPNHIARFAIPARFRCTPDSLSGGFT